MQILHFLFVFSATLVDRDIKMHSGIRSTREIEISFGKLGPWSHSQNLSNKMAVSLMLEN